MKIIKILVQVVLGILAIVLTYLCYKSIETPQQFKVISEQRNDKVIQRLKDIRTAQEAYKSLYSKYAGNFDELIRFLQNDSLKTVRSVGTLSDDQLEQGMTEAKAIAEGIIIRDTIRVKALDAIKASTAEKGDSFCNGYDIRDIRYVPFTNKKHEFQMGSKVIYSDSGAEVPVFEARVNNMVIFESLINENPEFKQQVLELNGETKRLNKYPGLKVGDINEPNNNVGNWQ